jgi:hypothetical protein
MEHFSFKRESSCFLVPGKEVLSVTTNDSAGMVEFDFFTIWEKLKTIKCSQVCMIHSHPSGFPVMSGTDWNMVYGWVQAIGKPILFVIITDNEYTYYLCERDKDNKNKVNRTIVNWTANESFESLCSVIYYMSCCFECPVKESLDKVTAILNESFSDAKIEMNEEVTA